MISSSTVSSMQYIPIKKVVGFIMDGNRRWATNNQQTLVISYTKGAEVFYMAVLECLRYKIEAVVFYALSIDNFNKRDEEELTVIYNVGISQLTNKKDFFINNKIKIAVVGNKNKCKKEIYDAIIQLEKDTDFLKPIMTIFILIIYDPYEDVFNSAADKKLLYSNDVPNIDLIIRTGGYNRLSGFLPIQSMNANIIVLKEFWPDFTKKKLYSILTSYQNNQNYGR
jgi:undecaprenyl diphosphate synthase